MAEAVVEAKVLPHGEQGYLLGPKIVVGLIERLPLAWLLGKFPEQSLWAGFMFFTGFITIGVLATLAL